MSTIDSILRVISALTPAAFRPSSIMSQILAEVDAGGTVVAGPFRGMIFPTESVGSANWPKRLGVYEQELVPTIESIPSVYTRTVINVGAAEGYYAIGCARRWPESRIVAFEYESTGRALINEYATRNAVAKRIDVRGTCTLESLHAALQEAKYGLVLMDVEGMEDELLAGPNITALASFCILVELHDLRRANLGSRLRARFEATHHIEEIATRSRRAGDFVYVRNPLLRLYLFRQFRYVSDERRGPPMRWFMMTPREATTP